jgi:4,5-DOPA dioxygenase extradiol
MLPSLFVSHGAPTLPFDDIPAREFLRGLGRRIGKPRAVLIASAHWDTLAPMVTSVPVNSTIHDFYGFPKPLYDLRYAAPGDPALAERVSGLLGVAGMMVEADKTRGLDHGAWVPLRLMYPDADIPVVQLSVQSGAGAAHHIAMGRALAQLRQDNVLVMGSGGFVHNLRRLGPPGAPEPDWSRDFSNWMHERLMARDEGGLTGYRGLAPQAVLAQPSEEHFMPLFFAYGAGGEEVERLHSSNTFGSLRMDAYAFG